MNPSATNNSEKFFSLQHLQLLWDYKYDILPKDSHHTNALLFHSLSHILEFNVLLNAALSGFKNLPNPPHSFLKSLPTHAKSYHFHIIYNYIMPR